MSNFKILLTISTASVLLPNIGGLIAFRNLNSEGKRILLFYIAFIFIDFTIAWFARHQMNNMPIVNILTFFEFGFYTYLFYTNIENPNFKKSIKITVWIYFIFSIATILFFRSMYEFNSETRALESLFLAFYSLLYFITLSYKLQFERVSLFKIPMFWISIGVLFYFSGNFFLFLFYREITQISRTMWSLHSVVNITTNAIFMLSFLCRLKSI